MLERTAEGWKLFFQKEERWTFYEPTYKEVPEPRAEYIPSRSNLNRVAELRRYLLDTFITEDSFADHNERMGRLKELGAWGWYMDHSKLATSRHTAVFGSMQLLMENLEGTQPELFIRLKEVFDPWLATTTLLGLTYKNLDFKGKVAAVTELDTVVYRFLEVLSK